MRAIQALISIFILAVAAFSFMGILWWNHPPEKLAHYSGGGKVILGVLIAGCAVGLWRLWAPAKSNHSH
jgi:hypothetical protein